MLTEPSLWGFLQDCQSKATTGEYVSRLPQGTVLVTGGGPARKVLVDDRARYKEQSGFLRIGSDVVDRTTRTDVVRNLINALKQHDFKASFDIHRTFSTMSDTGPIRLSHQSWGVRCILEYFKPFAGCTRNSQLNHIVDRYVQKSIIPDDIQGRLIRSRTVVARTRKELSDLFEMRLDINDPPYDLVDVVHLGAPSLSVAAKAELFQRLILSLVGFTGITLEWVMIFAALYGVPALTTEAISAHISESLRLRPTAWRLARTVTESHDLGSCPVMDGEHLLVSINAIHNDEEIWEGADEFRPGRWDEVGREQKDAYIPFGRGPEMCPSERFARRALEYCAESIFRNYEVVTTIEPDSRPKALTLLSPAAGDTLLFPKPKPTGYGNAQ